MTPIQLTLRYPHSTTLVYLSMVPLDNEPMSHISTHHRRQQHSLYEPYVSTDYPPSVHYHLNPDPRTKTQTGFLVPQWKQERLGDLFFITLSQSDLTNNLSNVKNIKILKFLFVIIFLSKIPWSLVIYKTDLSDL